MKVFLSLVILLLALNSYSQTTYTWNGSASAVWANPSNWTPSGIPGAADNVQIGAAANACSLGSHTAIHNITLSGGGILELNGNTLTINGTTATFSSGTIQNGQLTVTGAVSTSMGPSAVTMNCNVSIHSGSISMRNVVFRGITDITKTGASDDVSNGGNTFHDAANITNAGAGAWRTGVSTADTYQQSATFNNTGSGIMSIANNSTGNYFGGVATFNNITTNPGSLIYVSVTSAGTVFNNDVVVSSTGGQGIQFCSNTSASATIAAGRSVSIGGSGFSGGTLLLRQLTQSGNAPMTLTATGTAEIKLGPSSSFGGALTVQAPNIYTTSSVFNDVVSLTKTDGTNSNSSAGGNTFHTTLTINYFSSAGTGYWSFANGNPDIYNGDVYVNNNSLDRIILGHNSGNNQFNGDVIITQVGASAGVALTWSTGSSITLAAGKTISIGAAGFDAGYLYIQGLTQYGNTPVNLVTAGTSSIYVGVGAGQNFSEIGGPLSISAPDIYIRGATFHSDVTITKTGGINNHNGGKLNIFNGKLSINQESNTGYFMLGYQSDDQFNDDIVVSSSSSGGIHLGWSTGTGRPVLAAGKTIITGGTGFSDGYLSLNGFTQMGSAPVNLLLTGISTYFRVGNNSAIGGAFTISSPGIYLDGCTFNGTADITKTGDNSNSSRGGNIFNGHCSITNNGNSYLLLGNSEPDIWNADVQFTNNGTNRILPAWGSDGNQFNGNIDVNSSAGATGIHFCGGNSTATATLAAGGTITSSNGFDGGYLILRQFTQLGNAPVSLSFGSTAGYLQFGPSSSFGGNINTVTPGILFHGSTFFGTVHSVKSGADQNTSSGGNIFHNNTTITNAGTGSILMGNGNGDIFNNIATFNNTGSASLYIAYNSSNNIFNGVTTFNNAAAADRLIYVSQYSAGTVFNDDIFVSSISGSGIYFCSGNATATATLATGKTIAIGPGGFTSGTLMLKQFTQLGNAPVDLPMAATSTVLRFGPSSAFGGNVTSSSADLYFTGCIFSGTVHSVKTGSGSNASSGNNIFNAPAVLTNAGSGYLMMGNTNADQFNAAATFNNTGSSSMYIAHNSPGNIFGGIATFNNVPSGNGQIYVSTHSTGTLFSNNIVVTSINGDGVSFCSGNATATATLAAGRTISIGPGGFSSGTLLLKQFTQPGSTAQALALTGTGRLVVGPSSSFGGTVSISSPGILFNGTVFSSQVYATKTGSSNDASAGNNIFNGPFFFINEGTGYSLFTNSSPDIYNDHVRLEKAGSGLIYPNYNQAGTYNGNLSISSGTVITFGSNTGTAIFNGAGAQAISVSPGTPTPVFSRLDIRNTGPGVTLNAAVNVSRTLALTSGLLHTNATNIVTMLNNSAVAAGNALSASYVNGPMRYQKSSSGTSVLNFPVGKQADCRPVILTVSHTNSSLYTYYVELHNASAAALGYTLPPLVDSVSRVHYYTINRLNASGVSQPATGLSGNQTIEVFFGENDLVTNGNATTIVKNTPAAPNEWSDIGGAGAPAYDGGLNLTGSIRSTSTPAAFNSFSHFALAYRVMHILADNPVKLEAATAENGINLKWKTMADEGKAVYTIERSHDGVRFEAINILTVNETGRTGVTYNHTDDNPHRGRNIYRIKRLRMDGSYAYSNTVAVQFNALAKLLVYPNPSAGTVSVRGLQAGKVLAEWYDISGRLVLTQSETVVNGMAKLTTNLPDGIYVLRFNDEGIWKAERIIIRK